MHTVLYLVYELVGLAAVQEGPDGREGVQDDGLRVGIHVVLKNTSEHIDGQRTQTHLTRHVEAAIPRIFIKRMPVQSPSIGE